ncbi:MAG: ATP-binding protein [Fibrobacterota bacterium]
MNTKLLPREHYVERLRPFMDKPIVKVITGMRRVGKSGVLELVSQALLSKRTPRKNILYINKESLEFSFIETYKDLDSYVKKSFKGVTGSKYLFIDEIQDIEGWEKAASSILAGKQCDIYLTGSNATLLSSELSTLLTGRTIETDVYPLSFREYLLFRQAHGGRRDIEKEFDGYLRYGGLPGIHAFTLEDEIVYAYLNSVLDAIIYKDIVKRHKIRDISLFERVLAFVFGNCGHLTSAKSISDFLKSQRSRANVATVQDYCRAMEQSYLVHKLRRYDLKGRRHLEYAEKFYMGDAGIRHGLVGYADRDIAGILENVVALELLRRGYKLSVGSLSGLEVDFVAQKQGETLYVQVCSRLADGKTVDREFGNLERINDNYPKRVLSLEKHFQKDRKGITHTHISDFLLEN